MSKRIALHRALAIIVASMLLTSGIFFTLARSVQKYLYWRTLQPKYAIKTLTQRPRGKTRLPTSYLAECLHLSDDIPTSYFNLKRDEAERALLKSPFIASCRVKKRYPSHLIIDYMAHTPLAILYDVENTLIDERGHLLPHYPFFIHERLPELYLGLKEYDPSLYGETAFWEAPLDYEDLSLAKELLRHLQEREFEIKRLDLSHARDVSLGRREIVVHILNKNRSHHLLRLPTKNWEEPLYNYFGMRDKEELSTGDFVIDLRLPSLAYLYRK